MNAILRDGSLDGRQAAKEADAIIITDWPADERPARSASPAPRRAGVSTPSCWRCSCAWASAGRAQSTSPAICSRLRHPVPLGTAPDANWFAAIPGMGLANTPNCRRSSNFALPRARRGEMVAPDCSIHPRSYAIGCACASGQLPHEGPSACCCSTPSTGSSAAKNSSAARWRKPRCIRARSSSWSRTQRRRDPAHNHPSGASSRHRRRGAGRDTLKRLSAWSTCASSTTSSSPATVTGHSAERACFRFRRPLRPRTHRHSTDTTKVRMPRPKLLLILDGFPNQTSFGAQQMARVCRDRKAPMVANNVSTRQQQDQARRFLPNLQRPLLERAENWIPPACPRLRWCTIDRRKASTSSLPSFAPVARS